MLNTSLSNGLGKELEAALNDASRLYNSHEGLARILRSGGGVYPTEYPFFDYTLYTIPHYFSLTVIIDVPAWEDFRSKVEELFMEHGYRVWITKDAVFMSIKLAPDNRPALIDYYTKMFLTNTERWKNGKYILRGVNAHEDKRC